MLKIVKPGFSANELLNKGIELIYRQKANVI